MKKKVICIMLIVFVFMVFLVGWILAKNNILNIKYTGELIENASNQESENIDKSYVSITNGVIRNENLIDEFINLDEKENKKLEIHQDDNKIIVEYIKPEYNENNQNKTSNIEIGNNTEEDNKKYFGYYKLKINDDETRTFSRNKHSICRSTNINDNKVAVFFDSYSIDYAEIPLICEYNLDSSNYTKQFELNYMPRKDMGIKEVYDNGDYKVKTFAGNVTVCIEQDMVFSLEDALSNKVLTCEQIIEQAKMDERYGICKKGYYSDGGSIEYCYYSDIQNQYTILKLNTLDGKKDLVIGFAGPILSKYNTELTDEDKQNKQDENSNRRVENVLIVVDTNTITPSNVSITITDNNKNPFGWGVEFRVQEKKNGEWKDLKYISEDLAWIEIAYVLNENNQLTQNLDIEKYYGKLSKGIYRIVKPVYDNGYIDIYSNEFEIK